MTVRQYATARLQIETRWMNRRSSRRSTLVAVLALATGACGGTDGGNPPTQPTGGISDAARQYLDRALQIMEMNSVKRLTIDWPAFKAAILVEAAGAQSPADTYPAIGAAIRRLDDGHSSFRDAAGTVVVRFGTTCPPSSASSPVVPPTVGYVRVPAFSGTGDAATAFADGIQREIVSADRDDLIGWIVDLRGNGGGNMWPMVAGVGPVLGDGLAGFFIDFSGRATAWDYQSGTARLDGVALQQVTTPYQLKRGRPRVAVLIDGAVASSGEATAIAFRARTDARSFGTPTCGLSTAVQGFPMSDGATLFLTVVVMADRTRTPYGAQVTPDEVVTDPAQTVERAIAWLRDPS
jgi:carboxyl-terminal processing protease